VAADAILGEPASATQDRQGAPRVVFTDPQVAAVGLTLDEARKRGLRAVAIDLDTEANAGGSFYGHGAEGKTRFVVDEARRVLVGVTFVGPEMADFLQAATIAVVAEVPIQRLAHAIAPFPTRSELWLQFVEAYERHQGASMHAG
jgi:dihydrolipoamide dehydrogenase